MNDTLTKRDNLVVALKNVGSMLPKFGLLKKPVFHREGVSFVVAVKDEERWVEPCILSVLDVADEVIIIDSSVKDSTTKIVEHLTKSCDKIKHIRFYWQGANAFALALHIGLVSANFKWVFKWDSDLVAKSPEALSEWLGRLKRLDKDRYHVIDVPRVNLEGDLKHQPGALPFGAYEARLFTWSPELRCALKDNYWEQFYGDSIWGHRFPPWFQTHRWHEPYIFHCNIKNPKRMLTRLFWGDYMAHKENGFACLEDYAAYRVRNDWGMSVAEAQKKVMADTANALVPYDNARFGDLPKILQGDLF